MHQDLVRKGKELEGEAVMICCAHGDVSLYPIAEVDLELEGVQMQVKAAVSNTLPVMRYSQHSICPHKQLIDQNIE